MTTWNAEHPLAPHAAFDGGDLDCGNGLLLLIRKHIDPLDGGQVLEVKSTDATVEVELPAWCRLTGNELVSAVKAGGVRSYLIRKRGSVPLSPSGEGDRNPSPPSPSWASAVGRGRRGCSAPCTSG